MMYSRLAGWSKDEASGPLVTRDGKTCLDGGTRSVANPVGRSPRKERGDVNVAEGGVGRRRRVDERAR